MNKKNWQKIKKQLPRNYIQQTIKILDTKGFQLSRCNVSDVIRQKNKDPQTVQKVLSAIKTVKTNHQRTKARLKKKMEAL